MSTSKMSGRPVFEHKGFYFHEDRGQYITYSWTGVDDRYEMVVIGDSEAEARQTIDETHGSLGGGLEVCSEPAVVARLARRCQEREADDL